MSPGYFFLGEKFIPGPFVWLYRLTRGGGGGFVLGGPFGKNLKKLKQVKTAGVFFGCAWLL